MSDYSPISRPVPMYKEIPQNLTFDYLESEIHSLEYVRSEMGHSI